jgi:hypothetical protein
MEKARQAGLFIVTRFVMDDRWQVQEPWLTLIIPWVVWRPSSISVHEGLNNPIKKICKAVPIYAGAQDSLVRRISNLPSGHMASKNATA